MKASGGWAGSDRVFRLPPDWDERKAEAFRVYGDVCWMCGGTGADTIDHLTPGDDHGLANLRPVHDRRWPNCHRKKSSAEGHAAQRRIRSSGRYPREAHPGLT